jgi:hypothetical protein
MRAENLLKLCRKQFPSFEWEAEVGSTQGVVGSGTGTILRVEVKGKLEDQIWAVTIFVRSGKTIKHQFAGTGANLLVAYHDARRQLQDQLLPLTLTLNEILI